MEEGTLDNSTVSSTLQVRHRINTNTYNCNMLSQSNTLVYYTTLVLALFHASTAIASPTPTIKRDTKNSVQAPPITQSGAAARLRQTSWREIQARDALRRSPLYRRQASAVPYLSCQATYSSSLGVARYPNVELYGGDVS